MRRFSRSIVSAPTLNKWWQNGYIIMKDLFSPHEKAALQRYAREIQDWPFIAGQHMHYYEAAPNGGSMLCRTENYLDFHRNMYDLLGPKSKASQAAAALMSEPDGCVLFKERINYKLPGGGGFAPHQDAPAWSGNKPTAAGAELHFMKSTLNMNIAVDHMTPENGCLYVVPGMHNKLYPQKPDGTLTDEFCEAQNWIPVVLEPGDALFFSLHIPHSSPPNRTDRSRTAIYITYAGRSCADESEKERYYAEYRKVMPPAGEQRPDDDHKHGHAVYSWATPMLEKQPAQKV